MQREQIKQYKCKSCEMKTKHVRHVTAMGCGDLIMTLSTFGLWVILRAILTPGFHCDKCGKRR